MQNTKGWKGIAHENAVGISCGLIFKSLKLVHRHLFTNSLHWVYNKYKLCVQYTSLQICDKHPLWYMKRELRTYLQNIANDALGYLGKVGQLEQVLSHFPER